VNEVDLIKVLVEEEEIEDEEVEEDVVVEEAVADEKEEVIDLHALTSQEEEVMMRRNGSPSPSSAV